jgi:DNA-binding NarL/FixJ family response regulator
VNSVEDKLTIRLLLAVNTRELKTAFFLTLSDESNIQIVATAVNTAELLTYNRSLKPHGIVLEWDLAGRQMSEVYPVLIQDDPPPSIFIVGKPSSEPQIRGLVPDCDLYTDPENLVKALKAQVIGVRNDK